MPEVTAVIYSKPRRYRLFQFAPFVICAAPGAARIGKGAAHLFDFFDNARSRSHTLAVDRRVLRSASFFDCAVAAADSPNPRFYFNFKPSTTAATKTDSLSGGKVAWRPFLHLEILHRPRAR